MTEDMNVAIVVARITIEPSGDTIATSVVEIEVVNDDTTIPEGIVVVQVAIANIIVVIVGHRHREMDQLRII